MSFPGPGVEKSPQFALAQGPLAPASTVDRGPGPACVDLGHAAGIRARLGVLRLAVERPRPAGRPLRRGGGRGGLRPRQPGSGGDHRGAPHQEPAAPPDERLRLPGRHRRAHRHQPPRRRRFGPDNRGVPRRQGARRHPLGLQPCGRPCGAAGGPRSGPRHRPSRPGRFRRAQARAARHRHRQPVPQAELHLRGRRQRRGQERDAPARREPGAQQHPAEARSGPGADHGGPEPGQLRRPAPGQRRRRHRRQLRRQDRVRRAGRDRLRGAEQHRGSELGAQQYQRGCSPG